MATLRSLAYPLALENGGLKLVENEAVLYQSILSVLETRPLERVMQPAYGTPDFVFHTDTGIGIVVERIRIALEMQIPDLVFAVSGVLGEEGTYLLTIQWEIDRVPQLPIQYRLAGS